MKQVMKYTAGLLGVVLLLATAHAEETVAPAGQAQAAPPPDGVITVQANHAGTMPYHRWYTMAHDVREATDGQIVMGIRLERNGHTLDVGGLRMALMAGEQEVPIAWHGGSQFDIPIVDGLAGNASNFVLYGHAAESIDAKSTFTPAHPDAPWDMHRMRTVVEASRKALRAIMPWYARLVAQPYMAVGVCSTNAASVVQLKQGDTVTPFKVDFPAVNRLGEPVLCKRFDGREGFADDAQLALTPDQEVVLL